FLYRAVIGWLVMACCQVAIYFSKPVAPTGMFFGLGLLPLLSTLAFKRSLPTAWFDERAGKEWLRAVLLDEPAARYPFMREGLRQELKSGRSHRLLRLQELAWCFRDESGKEAHRIEKVRDLVPFFELVGWGIPIVVSL